MGKPKTRAPSQDNFTRPSPLKHGPQRPRGNRKCVETLEGPHTPQSLTNSEGNLFLDAEAAGFQNQGQSDKNLARNAATLVVSCFHQTLSLGARLPSRGYYESLPRSR